MPFSAIWRDTGERSYEQGLRLFDKENYPEAEREFRAAVAGRTDKLGELDQSTLDSKLMLGVSLFRQKKYSEAEQYLRQTVLGREKTLGPDHKDPLDSNYWLGLSLYKQGKYSEVEQYFRQVVLREERLLGPDHKDTLDSKYWLGLSLYKQGKYSEAEQYLRQTVLGREKTLGPDHKDTLKSNYWLANSLYKQGKYSEVEQYFRQIVLGEERLLGPDHKDTLDSKYWLGLSLCKQGKYSEAEQYLRQTVLGREKTLGPDHKNTLKSNYWLANSLCKQGKYSEAEQYFRQIVLREERLLGPDHKDTLESKDSLAKCLFQQEQQHTNAKNDASQGIPGSTLRYQSTGDVYANGTPQSAESLTEGGESKDRSSDGMPAGYNESTRAPLPADGPIARSDTIKDRGLDNILGSETARLNEFFAENGSTKSAYNDSEISIISRLLAHQNLQWSKVPRTYIVLRNINCLHLLDSIIASGFTDYWFPVVAKNLPAVLHMTQKSDFVNAQKLVLTRSLDLEKGAEGQHCYFTRDDKLPLEKLRVLGRGGFGQVDEVLSTIGYQKYARKRVLRRTILRGRKPEHVNSFISEIETLKRLQHKHIVQFVGSYSDTKYLALLMRPVAEMDLSGYLTRPDISSRFGELRTFFGCLATALDFLHTQSVRHKDIKPGNILIDHGNILFTDFGLSYDFTDAQVSTTMSMVNGITPQYCAPEVALCEPRNKSSDIWSLGVVYLEMLATLKGLTIEYMNDYFAEHGTQQPYIRTNREGFTSFVESLKSVGSRGDNQVINWINDMLQVEGRKRPHAGLLVATIKDTPENQYGSQKFCGICCLHDGDDDSFSDFSD